MPQDPTIQRADEEFREVCAESVYTSETPQKVLADLNRVTQPQISRWFAYAGDNPLPAFRIALLPKAIATPIIKFLAGKFGSILIERNPSKESLDGEVTDEVLQLAERVGTLAGEVKTRNLDIKKCRDGFERVIIVANKALDELRSIESGKLRQITPR